MSDYAEFLRHTPQGTIFCQPWWLEAVAPGRHRVLEVRNQDGIQAAWPLVWRDLPLVGRQLVMPRLTPYLGPLLAPPPSWTKTRQLSYHRQLLEALLEQMPPYASLDAYCHPAFEWWMPLYWKGFQATTWYTHAFPAPIDPATVWSGMRDTLQRRIRKARRQGLTVEPHDDLGLLWPVWEATFARQGKKMPVSRADFERLEAACRLREARTMLLARDGEGAVQGFAYLVHDHRCCYYLAGGAHPETRQSGAQSLVLWHALERAADRGLSFDFEGSIIQPIERFFRTFGSQPRPYLVLYRDRHAMSYLLRAARWWNRSRKAAASAE